MMLLPAPLIDSSHDTINHASLDEDFRMRLFLLLFLVYRELLFLPLPSLTLHHNRPITVTVGYDLLL